MVFSNFANKAYHSTRHKKAWLHNLRKLLFFLCLILLIRLGISWLGFESYAVKTRSMHPSLALGDRVLTTPLIYGIKVFNKKYFTLHKPEYGDLVLVQMKDDRSILDKTLGYAASFFFLARLPKPEYIIRRVIALPGDVVSIHDYQAKIVPKGEKEARTEHELSKKEYSIDFLPIEWSSDLPFSPDMESRVVKAGEYFLLADNRDEGLDHRHWSTSPVIEAGIFLRYWPPSRISLF